MTALRTFDAFRRRRGPIDRPHPQRRLIGAAIVCGLIAAASADAPEPLPQVAPTAWRVDFRGDPDDPLAATAQAAYGGAAVDPQGNTYLVYSAIGPPAPERPRLPPSQVGVAKFAADGQLVWTDVIDDAGFEDFQAAGIVLTSDGNVAVVGVPNLLEYAAIVASYDAAGTRRWLHRIDDVSEPLVAAGPAGSVTVAMSGTNGGWELVRYAADGTMAFDVSRAPKSSAPHAIAVDAAGATFLAGYGPPPPFPQGGPSDGVLVKVGPTGAEDWRAPLPEGSGGLACDDEGGVVAAAGKNMTTTAYDSQGGVRWQRSVDGYGYAAAIVRDGAGRWIVANIGGGTVATAVFEDDGTLAWSRGWICAGNHPAGAGTLALDGTGGVHVAAMNRWGLAMTQMADTEILHYDAAGGLLSIASIRLRLSNGASQRSPSLMADGAGGVVFAASGVVRLRERRDATTARIVKIAGAPSSGVGRVKPRERQLRFGALRAGAGFRERAMKIRNTSRTASLVVRVESAAAPFFGGGVTYDIAPGAALKVPISFIPTDARAVKQTLTITTSDPERPSLRLGLSGRGK